MEPAPLRRPQDLPALLRPEVRVAKTPLYALKCYIPHFARGHMLRFSSPEAVLATGDSGSEEQQGRKIPGNPSTASPNCRTFSPSVVRPMITSCAPGADFGLWRTAIDDSTHKTPLHVRLSGEIQAKSNSGRPTQTRNEAGHFEIQPPWATAGGCIDLRRLADAGRACRSTPGADGNEKAGGSCQ